MNFRHLYTSFDGRINRKPFWLASIAMMVAALVVSLVVVVPLTRASRTLGALASLILALVLLYPAVALGVKRLHDRGLSGRLMAVFVAPGLVSQVGNLLGITTREQTIAGQSLVVPNTLGMIIGLVGLAVGIWAFITLGLRKGTPGANAWGPDPLEAPVQASKATHVTDRSA